MFRRRKKLYFKNTVSKFPAIIFVISVIIGGFFLFKIISTLVKESESAAEFAPIEVKTETKKKTEIVTPPKEIVSKPAKISKPAVKPPTEKTVVKTTNQEKQVITPVSSEFYTIQVATFSDMRRTQNLANELKKNFSPVYIKIRGKLFEVCVGKFSNPQEGHEVLSKIRKDFHDAFSRRIQPPFEEK
ncbi:MAG: SPOR domain-containing protein [Candidatus Omnitrophica bacterium]|nr:SPOR domain-containing protein [Candidatus Omnitrophota bacterium]MBU1047182.1 SPOR domain-containing protein [Candidatus Omnitrophota bacterium]MBU1630254.1 SPOR domain-containing protein [Candidatus Omnitrophota bacterium]MBU1889482.1 SPOR domain-containing protein [Candidatus Omnitrophota bacterium]